MKRVLLLIAMVAITNSVFAQKVKPPKVAQIEKFLKENNLAEAKSVADRAIEYPKTMENGKAWYLRGLVYATIDTSSNAANKALAGDALKTAMASFAKSEDLKKGNNEYFVSGPNGLPLLKTQQIDGLWASYLNKGVKAYENEEYTNAVAEFTKCQVVKPQDTTGYFYAGLSARSAEDYATAGKNFTALIEKLDNHNPDVYKSLIYIEGTVNKDNDKALYYVREAKKRFPKDITLQREEINLLIKMDKMDEAKAGLEQAVKEDPTPDLYFSLGAIYDELKEFDKAQNAYESAIKLDDVHYASNFNLAALFYNEAVELIKEKNDLGISSADRKKSKDLEIVIKEKLQSALPQWEKVYGLNDKEKSALETLKYIYLQLGMSAKADDIDKKLEGL